MNNLVYFLQAYFQKLQGEYWENPVTPKTSNTVFSSEHDVLRRLKEFISSYDGDAVLTANAIAAAALMSGNESFLELDTTKLKLSKRIVSESPRFAHLDHPKRKP